MRRKLPVCSRPRQADPADAETRLALLQLLVEAERWKEAEEAGDVLLQEESPPAAAHALMGIVYGKDRPAGTPPLGNAARRSKSSLTTRW